MDVERRLNVLVAGACGRLGKMVFANVMESTDMFVWGAIDKAGAMMDNDFNCYENVEELKKVSSSPSIIVDFSSPDLTDHLVDYAYERKLPIVIATTGLSKETEKKILEYSKEIPIFKSANMSYQVAALVKTIQYLVKFFGDEPDIEIVEEHGAQKKDKVSGTALMIADAINQVLNYQKVIVIDRNGERKDNEIGVWSVRGGNLPGTHTIKLIFKDEVIEIKHVAYSPKIFADGAMKAIRFLNRHSNNPGLYTMDDMVQ